MPITRAEVSHWMATLAGGDYYDLSRRHTIPLGLVSDPPNYGQCVTSLKAAAAASPRKIPGETGAKLLNKCHQLNRALRYQAMGLLVQVLWFVGVAGSEGLKASDAEVLDYYHKTTAPQFPKASELSAYQAARRVSTADELLLIKKNVLSQELLAKYKAQGAAATASITRAETEWTRKTDCSPGYVVEHCKQDKGEASAPAGTPPASVLIEQVAALATGRCINIPACAKP